jgi:hypothetical protein
MGRRNNRIQSRHERTVKRVRNFTPWFETDGQCLTGKLRFGTDTAAERALRNAQSARARMGSPKVERRYYPCGFCHGFHLTSQPDQAAIA